MLSNTCKYAIRSVIYLAVNAGQEKKIGIKKISEDLNIPTPFLGKILQNLAKQKLLSSTKGPHGGFGMGKEAEDISLIDIVEIVDGLDMFNSCIIGINPCKLKAGAEPCPVHSQFETIRKEIFDLFSSKTISELLDSDKNIEKYEFEKIY
ncbi:MAG: Rrf2 family transcriptional regulator [Marinifilaceae bacterium]|jgi:Rrf2 family protein|nr:Rrf2 family transcriptional regulator [Marinifilaceae bacterium]